MRRRQWRNWFVPASMAIGLSAAGCYGGDDLPRQPIAGSVTLNGHPLSHGVITFFPAQRIIEGDMVVAGAMIKNGSFSIPGRSGLIPGTYKIAVHSGERPDERRKDERDPGNEQVVPKEVIPRKYNSESVLEIQIKEHVVKHVKIDLTSE